MDTTTKKYVKEIDYRQIIKHDCPCGGKYSIANRNKHQKTKIHCEYVMSKYLESSERSKKKMLEGKSTQE
jgi:hypothetical protein